MAEDWILETTRVLRKAAQVKTQEFPAMLEPATQAQIGVVIRMFEQAGIKTRNIRINVLQDLFPVSPSTGLPPASTKDLSKASASVLIQFGYGDNTDLRSKPYLDPECVRLFTGLAGRAENRLLRAGIKSNSI